MAHSTSPIGLTTRLLAVFLAGLAACGDPRSDPGGHAAAPVLPSVRDSAGVEIVDVPGAALDILPVWRISPEPVISIGELEGDDAYLFLRVSAARRLDSDEIMITDQSLRVRIFGPDGRFRRSYGGRGEGPGEFDGDPLKAGETDGVNVSVYDEALARVTTLDLSTGEVKTQRVEPECRDSPESALRYCSVAPPLPDGTVFASRAASSYPPMPEDGRLVVLKPTAISLPPASARPPAFVAFGSTGDGARVRRVWPRNALG